MNIEQAYKALNHKIIGPGGNYRGKWHPKSLKKGIIEHVLLIIVCFLWKVSVFLKLMPQRHTQYNTKKTKPFNFTKCLRVRFRHSSEDNYIVKSLFLKYLNSLFVLLLSTAPDNSTKQSKNLNMN